LVFVSGKRKLLRVSAAVRALGEAWEHPAFPPRQQAAGWKRAGLDLQGCHGLLHGWAGAGLGWIKAVLGQAFARCVRGAVGAGGTGLRLDGAGAWPWSRDGAGAEGLIPAAQPQSPERSRALPLLCPAERGREVTELPPSAAPARDAIWS